MANETLSVKQADRIIEKANEVLARCKTELESNCNDFLKSLSTIWEDANAVGFSKKFDKIYTELLNNLNKNNEIFASTIRDISDMYVKAGNMSKKVSSTAKKVSGKLNSSVVKKNFSNTGNADDFGFLDIATGPQKVVDELNKFKSSISKVSSEMLTGMNSISAFGNINVSLAITKSAGSMISIVEKSMEKISTKAKQCLDETAKLYSNVGSNSVSAATLKVGALIGAAAAGVIDGIGSSVTGGTSPTPIQTFYAPPIGPPSGGSTGSGTSPI